MIKILIKIIEKELSSSCEKKKKKKYSTDF